MNDGIEHLDAGSSVFAWLVESLEAAGVCLESPMSPDDSAEDPG
jgi:hypothetical protein